MLFHFNVLYLSWSGAPLDHRHHLLHHHVLSICIAYSNLRAHRCTTGRTAQGSWLLCLVALLLKYQSSSAEVVQGPIVRLAPNKPGPSPFLPTTFETFWHPPVIVDAYQPLTLDEWAWPSALTSDWRFFVHPPMGSKLGCGISHSHSLKCWGNSCWPRPIPRPCWQIRRRPCDNWNFCPRRCSRCVRNSHRELQKKMAGRFSCNPGCTSHPSAPNRFWILGQPPNSNVHIDR